MNWKDHDTLLPSILSISCNHFLLPPHIHVRMYIHVCYTSRMRSVATANASMLDRSDVHANSIFLKFVFLQLLEKKKGQGINDLCQNLECFCHCMTTVGQKLDTERAKVCLMCTYTNTASHVSVEAH